MAVYYKYCRCFLSHSLHFTKVLWMISILNINYYLQVPCFSMYKVFYTMFFLYLFTNSYLIIFSERSRQSARECRARKKLRYQYLEELVADREKAVLVLRKELEKVCNSLRSSYFFKWRQNLYCVVVYYFHSCRNYSWTIN